MSILTSDDVAFEIERAVRALRHLPDKDRKYFVGLRALGPNVPPPATGTEEWWLTYGQHKATYNRVRLSPADIDMLDRVIVDWLPRLAATREPIRVFIGDDRRLSTHWTRLPDDAGAVVVWRAFGWSWRRIGRARARRGQSGNHETARRVHRGALVWLTEQVNSGAICRRMPPIQGVLREPSVNRREGSRRLARVSNG